VLTGVGAVVNTAQVRAGATVAVVGLGGVGLASVLGAIASGARQVIAIDLSEDKLALARSLGATHVFNAGGADSVEPIRQASAGGVDFAIEMAGSVRAFELAYRITRRGGTTGTAGLPPPNATWPMAPVHLVAEERTIKGSYIGTCVPSRDLPR
jgi:alcohol dehydrogenase